jgi:hypothetical protein
MTVGKINLFEDALPAPLFRRLVRVVEAVGTERMEDMGTYNTTFWLPLDTKPSNVVEECVVKLFALAEPGPTCIGMEWWLGRLRRGESLRFHCDSDRSLRKQTGQIVHPLWSSILYLNDFPGAPTMIYDQVLSPDGKAWIPPEPEFGRETSAIPNHYVTFVGNLRHGVIPKESADDASTPAASINPPELRLTLLVNYWDRRPAPPNCREYDGSIYPAIQSASIQRANGTRRRFCAA